MSAFAFILAYLNHNMMQNYLVTKLFKRSIPFGVNQQEIRDFKIKKSQNLKEFF